MYSNTLVDYMRRIPDPTSSIHDEIQLINASRILIVVEPLRFWRAFSQQDLLEKILCVT